jgi:hypothetical protein
MQDFYIDGFRTVLFSISDCETRLTWVWMTHLIMHALFEFKQVCSIWDKFVHCYNVFHRYKIKCGIFEVDFTYIICNMSEIIWTNSFIFADFQSFSQSETKIAHSHGFKLHQEKIRSLRSRPHKKTNHLKFWSQKRRFVCLWPIRNLTYLSGGHIVWLFEMTQGLTVEYL